MTSRVIRQLVRPPADVIAAYRTVGAASIHEAFGRRGAVDPAIKPLAIGMQICGPAITVRYHPGDNLMIHAAIALAEPGDVLVCECGGESDTSTIGEIMAVAAQARGLAGYVIDGYVRDAAQIRAMNYPVFSPRGLSMKGAVKETLGLINHPISFGGVPVSPGDVVLGDDDGVVIVPMAEAAAVLERAVAREAREAEIMKQLRAGKTTLELLGLDAVLAAKGLA